MLFSVPDVNCLATFSVGAEALRPIIVEAAKAIFRKETMINLLAREDLNVYLEDVIWFIL